MPHASPTTMTIRAAPLTEHYYDEYPATTWGERVTRTQDAKKPDWNIQSGYRLGVNYYPLLPRAGANAALALVTKSCTMLEHCGDATMAFLSMKAAKVSAACST